KALALCSDGSDAELQAAQKRLLQLYTEFVEKYGPINDKPNVQAFREDIRASFLRAIEEYNPDTTTGKPSQLFYRRTIGTATIPSHVDNASDALAISLAQYGEVRMEEISRLTGRTEAEILDELGSRIYRNPT